ncbi:winged helix-turn-helix domain-containing protein [Vibrio tapetis]|uniref:OmpR/PhoB-type domain-containing protein n=1 Tax=Vibrio tapetis subsp. tapetis TaxID=1671868 RepID=A0A2N8ZJ74_9VIBR|nr:winged helix-turn-helix domain-containing protein [Vibrio tapetis]SON51955.1 conserved protein of unknown function [Vibrio tapetis subsp. tapetis]
MRRTEPLMHLEVPVGDYVLKRTDVSAELVLGNGSSFSITIPESCILNKLLQNENKVVTKESLILEAWGCADIIGPNSLPVAITNLRKILKLANVTIVNIPRKGYLIELPDVYINAPVENSSHKVQVKSDPTEHSLKYSSKQTSHDYISSFSFYSSLVIIMFLLYVLFYIKLSWVEEECIMFDEGSVCFIKGNGPNMTTINKQKGSYYFSQSTGMIKDRLYD